MGESSIKIGKIFTKIIRPKFVENIIEIFGFL